MGKITRGKGRRPRYRSNAFSPKVKEPLSLELTATGHRLLKKTMVRCEKSTGDIFEKLLRDFSESLTQDSFPLAS